MIVDTTTAKTSELIKYMLQLFSLIDNRKQFIQAQEQMAKQRVIPFTQINEAKKEVKNFVEMLKVVEDELDKRVPVIEVKKEEGEEDGNRS